MTHENMDQARSYRALAAETRAGADTMASEEPRQGMLDAANVWDQLADLAECQGRGLASVRLTIRGQSR